jgi:hypothetical protein
MFLLMPIHQALGKEAQLLIFKGNGLRSLHGAIPKNSCYRCRIHNGGDLSPSRGNPYLVCGPDPAAFSRRICIRWMRSASFSELRVARRRLARIGNANGVGWSVASVRKLPADNRCKAPFSRR